MNIDLTKVLRTVKNVPARGQLVLIALAIIVAITNHQDVLIGLPLVVILAVIVFCLIHGIPRRH